jgi:hypothetical protein
MKFKFFWVYVIEILFDSKNGEDFSSVFYVNNDSRLDALSKTEKLRRPKTE